MNDEQLKTLPHWDYLRMIRVNHPTVCDNLPGHYR